MKEQLKQLKLNSEQASNDLIKNRDAILQLLENNGGQVPLSKAEAKQKYNTLKKDLHNANIEIIKFDLRLNNPLYEQLIISANAATENIIASVNKLNNINEIINSVAVVINLVGQILKVPLV